MRWSYAILLALVPLGLAIVTASVVSDPLTVRWLWFGGLIGAIALGIYLGNHSADSNTGV